MNLAMQWDKTDGERTMNIMYLIKKKPIVNEIQWKSITAHLFQVGLKLQIISYVLVLFFHFVEISGFLYPWFYLKFDQVCSGAASGDADHDDVEEFDVVAFVSSSIFESHRRNCQREDLTIFVKDEVGKWHHGFGASR